MTRLKIGDLAPELAGIDQSGTPVSLADMRGKTVLVAFFRYASCPLCNLRVHELRREFPALASKGLAILAVFQSPPQALAHYVGRQDAPFPLIGDPAMVHYRRWGVEASWWGAVRSMVQSPIAVVTAMGHGYWPGRIDGPLHRLPADFLVDANGRLQDVLYASHLGQHLSLQAIQAKLQ